ncbi:MAG TPA: ScyD/ScyE family protein [Thermoleophilaceae bacterium]
MPCFRVFLVASAAVLGSLLFAAGSAAAASGPKVTTVVSGLDNPRDLAFGPRGRLYVAEAGHGGSECVSAGEEGTACFGFSSGISRVNIQAGRSHRVVSGLASTAEETGSSATGVDGISFLGNGSMFGIMAGSRDAIPPGLSAATTTKLQQQAGRLIRVTPGRGVRFGADVGHEDFTWSAAHGDLVPGQFPDANPYGVLALPGATWVVDAGSNTIDRIDARGKVHVVAFIPNPPSSDAVPTCIDRSRHGVLYVGELTGGGNQPGASVVWRFTPRGHKLTQWATGLTAVTGCGFAHNGKFYATEFSTAGLDNAAPGTGAVVRVAPHSTSPRTVVSNLNFPGGFAAGGDGSLYVSNWSISPAGGGEMPSGEVLRIALRAKHR